MPWSIRPAYFTQVYCIVVELRTAFFPAVLRFSRFMFKFMDPLVDPCAVVCSARRPTTAKFWFCGWFNVACPVSIVLRTHTGFLGCFFSFCGLFGGEQVRTEDKCHGSSNGHGEGNREALRPAVLLMHGLMQDSESLLCGGRWGLVQRRSVCGVAIEPLYVRQLCTCLVL